MMKLMKNERSRSAGITKTQRSTKIISELFTLLDCSAAVLTGASVRLDHFNS